jgi:UMF1 family MFS transporter
MTKEEKSWILYDVANSAFSLIIVTAVMPVYYKSYIAGNASAADSTAYWGYANAAASLIVAFSAPVLGALADRENYKKRFLISFIGIGTAATFLLCAVGEGHWFLALFIYGISLIGFAGANIFYDSFLVDVTENERMDKISSSGYAWGYIGSVVPFVVAMGLIMAGKKMGQSILMTRIAFALTATWWLAFSIPIILNVKQRYFSPASSPLSESFRNLLNTLKNIRKNRNAFLFIIAYFLYIDGVDTIIKMAAPYGKDAGLSVQDLMLAVLVIQIVAFPFALIYGKLANVFSAKKMIFVGIAVYIIITLAGTILPMVESQKMKMILFWILAMLIASSQGGIQALSRSFFSRLIPKDKAGEFFGFYNIFGKFAAILGPFIMAAAIQLTGDSKFGFLSIAPLFIAGGAVLFFVNEQAKPAHSSFISEIKDG